MYSALVLRLRLFLGIALFGVLAPTAGAAPITPSASYARLWTVRYAKEQCQREGCKSVKTFPCTRWRGTVECGVSANYERGYCTYHTNTFYRDGILERSISIPRCNGV